MNDEFLKRRKFISGVLLLCILLGIACRFVGVNWDASFHLHPDERFLTMTATGLQWPHAASEYFETARAPLNPFLHGTDFFVYGQLPLLIVKAAASLLGRDNYNDLVLVGRVLSALFDCLTIFFSYLIAQKISGSRLFGLFAAALLSLTALNIQHSHFFVTDTFAATFLTASFYFALRTFDESAIRSSQFLIACGASFGAACACKFSSVLFAIVLIAFFIARRKIVAPRNASVVLFAALLSFRVFHPIAFRGEGGVLTLWGLLDMRLHPQFWNALSQQAQISSGKVDVPFNLQWFGRANWIWPLGNLGNWALGWPLIMCGIGGVVLVATRVRAKREVSLPILIAAFWVGLCLAFYGGQFSKFTRYYLVVTPFISLLVAWLVFQIPSHRIVWRVARRIVAAGVLAYSLIWSLAITSIYTREHPRIAATQWILQNIPSHTPTANETAWDDALPLQNMEKYRALDLKLFDRDDQNKRAHLLQTLDETDWIFVSSPRVWKTVPRLSQRFLLTNEYYRALFDGRLGFTNVKEFHSFPQILGWEFNDENVEEALTVYDHPRVFLFRKTPEYSRANAERILSEGLLIKAQSSSG